MTETLTPDVEIDAAVEQVVRIGSSDRDALTETVRGLAGMLGYDLAPKAAAPLHVGDHGACVCGVALTHLGEPHGCWWTHGAAPTDGHNAELGGPA